VGRENNNQYKWKKEKDNTNFKLQNPGNSYLILPNYPYKYIPHTKKWKGMGKSITHCL
jgi:hypothetical protein